jgi:hypothetical protein
MTLERYFSFAGYDRHYPIPLVRPACGFSHRKTQMDADKEFAGIGVHLVDLLPVIVRAAIGCLS